MFGEILSGPGHVAYIIAPRMAPPDPPSLASPGPGPPRLVRAIGRWDLTASVVNSVIGSGIFAMPAVLASGVKA